MRRARRRCAHCWAAGLAEPCEPLAPSEVVSFVHLGHHFRIGDPVKAEQVVPVGCGGVEVDVADPQHPLEHGLVVADVFWTRSSLVADVAGEDAPA